MSSLTNKSGLELAPSHKGFSAQLSHLGLHFITQIDDQITVTTQITPNSEMMWMMKLARILLIVFMFTRTISQVQNMDSSMLPQTGLRARMWPLIGQHSSFTALSLAHSDLCFSG